MKRFCELEKKEFIGFAEKVNSRNFLQSIEMYERYRLKGFETYLVGVKEGEEIICATLMNTRRKVLGKKIFVAPRGVLMDFERRDSGEILKFFTQEVKKFLKTKAGLTLQISPNVRMRNGEYEGSERSGRNEEDESSGRSGRDERDGEDGGDEKNGRNKRHLRQVLVSLGYKELGEFEQVKWIYSLDLRGKTAEEIYKKFRSGHKWSIRYANERYGVSLRELKKNELGIFKCLTEEASKKHGFADPGLDYYQEMKETFDEKVKFVVAEMKDPETGKKVVMAGGMFVAWGDEVVYLFSGSLDRYKKYGGPHLIQWEMIKFAISNGFLKYNFYGTHPGDGVYEFKSGFRGKMEELVGTFVLPLSILGRIYLSRLRYQKYGKIH